jgi:hypothetical protein
MFPSFLVPVIIIAIVTLIALLIYAVPLELSSVAEYTGNKAVVIVLVSWSIVCLRVMYTAGRSEIELLLLGKPLYRKSYLPALFPEPKIPSGYVDARTVISRIQGIMYAWPGILRMLRAVRRQTYLRHLSCDLVFGTGSPAITGMVFGIFSAVRPLLMVSDRVSISLEPVFDQEMLEGKSQIDLRLNRPLIVLVLLVRLFLSPSMRHALKLTPPRKGDTGI